MFNPLVTYSAIPITTGVDTLSTSSGTFEINFRTEGQQFKYTAVNCTVTDINDNTFWYLRRLSITIPANLSGSARTVSLTARNLATLTDTVLFSFSQP